MDSSNEIFLIILNKVNEISERTLPKIAEQIEKLGQVIDQKYEILEQKIRKFRPKIRKFRPKDTEA